MADAPLLEVADIETSYGLSRVLFGISLAVAPGEMVSLMGRNGMGKTTTVRSIMGLTPSAAGTSVSPAEIPRFPPIASPSLVSDWCPKDVRSFPT